MPREDRRVLNIKQDSINEIDYYPSNQSVAEGEIVISHPKGKTLKLYKKLKGMLWWIDFTNDGNQFVDKNLEIKQNLTVGNNVGIGAADPGSLLEVRGGVGTGFTGAGQLTLSTAEESIADNDVLGVIAFQSPKETGADAILPSAAIWGESEATFDASNNDTALVFATANSETVLATAQERMRIDSSGNVGIGEIAPEGNLHISSLTDATIILEADTDDNPEGDNPRIELIQDGGNVHGFLGIEGIADSSYAGSIANAVYLESKNIESDGSKIQFVTGGDYDAEENGTVRMTVTDTGNITKPANSCFFLYPTADQNDIAEGTNSSTDSVTIVFGGEQFDLNGNCASNTFTAPVTGKYFLHTNLTFNRFDTGADHYLLQIVTSNRTYQNWINNKDWTADSGYHTITLTAIADMDASDTAYVTLYQDGGTGQTDIVWDSNNSPTRSYFTGYLIG